MNLADSLLELKMVTKYFGGIAAVKDLSLTVSKGEIAGLIGPNGAGKTTLFNLISGIHRVSSGTIKFNGEPINHLKTYEIARKGLIRTFQSNVLFKNFSVLQNVLVGCHLQVTTSMFMDLFNFKSVRKSRQNLFDTALRIIGFVGLDPVRNELAMNLSHGHQRMLGVALALAGNPSLILLDEPVSGMNNEEKTEMMQLIKKTRESGISVILVEHDMRVVMELCDHITVLNFGMKIAEGTPDEIKSNQSVVEAYLGADE